MNETPPSRIDFELLESRCRLLEQDNRALREKLVGRSRDLYDLAQSRGRRLLELEQKMRDLREMIF